MAQKPSTLVDFKKVKAAVTIEQVLGLLGHLDELAEKPGGLKGVCPLVEHGSRFPFHVDTGQHLWYCHACAEGGNAVELLAAAYELDFSAACRFAVETFALEGVERQPQPRRRRRKRPARRSKPLPSENEAQNRPVTDDLEESRPSAPPDSRSGGVPREIAYLEDLVLDLPVTERVAANPPLGFELKGVDPHHAALTDLGLQASVLEIFGAGFYSGRGFLKGRLVFPIYDRQGVLVAFGGLSLEDGSYLYPKTFRPELELYNAHRCRGRSDGEIQTVASPLAVWRAVTSSAEARDLVAPLVQNERGTVVGRTTDGA